MGNTLSKLYLKSTAPRALGFFISLFVPLLVAAALFFPRAMLIQQQWSQVSGRTMTFTEMARQPLACAFDCNIYADIATGKIADKTATAFFPGWSSTIRWVSKVFPRTEARVLAFILSNFFLLLSAALAFCLARNLSLATPATRLLFLPAALLLFPYGIPGSFGYGEPFFLFFYILSFYFLTQEKLVPAALVLGILGITRPQGVWIAGIFAFLVFLSLLVERGVIARNPWKWTKEIGIGKGIAAIVLSLSPFALYVLWQWKIFHDPIAFVHAQSAWGRHFTLGRALLDNVPLPKTFPVMIWICLLGSFVALKKRDFSWAFLGLSTISLTELPLFSGGMMSYPRYLSANLGLFVFFSEFLATRSGKYSRYVELAAICWLFIALFSEANWYLTGHCP